MDNTANSEFDSDSPDTVLPRDSVAYTANFCEENVWHLCQRAELKGWERFVVFISNLERGCPFFKQRASPEPIEFVLWDYHVVLLARPKTVDQWSIFDVDSRLEFPLSAASYLRETFPQIDQISSRFWPSFRVISADGFIETFSSDRSHMRDEQGSWLATPPDWPLIGVGREKTLGSYIDFGSKTYGEIIDLATFRSRFGKSTGVG
jgi:protein N-terminal glutamine amidohydrolase